MAGTLITVPAFAGARDGIQHFFGTRHQATGVDSRGGSVTPGVPIGQGAAGGDRRSKNGPVQRVKRPPVVVSVRQVHGTDALVLDRPLEAGETFAGGWDALMTNQSGVLLTCWSTIRCTGSWRPFMRVGGGPWPGSSQRPCL